MGTLVDAEADGERGTDASNARKICASDPVVYQLVRVEGDGRLVPATDDEVMEVGHLLEDDKSKPLSIEATRCKEGRVYDVIFTKKSDLQCSQGISKSENTKDDSHRSDARLEVSHESLNHSPRENLQHSPKYMDVDGQSTNCDEHSQACSDNLQPDNTSLETDPASVSLISAHNAQLENADEAVTCRSAASETCTSSQPDFSILNGEICLDDLSIRGLQEAFRASFGRQTSVKDKLWLKRRIAMGLTNSCDIPSTRFVIKENKIVHKKVEESPCMVQNNFYETGVLPADQVIGLLNDDRRDSPSNLKNQIGDQVLSANRPTKPQLEYDTNSVNLQMEQCAGKRVRKPTRRFIEELSDVDDTRECTSSLVPSIKNSGLGQSSKSRIRPVLDVGSQGTTFVTRQDSLGGYDIRIPYVSRVRRGRPRKNFITFLNFVNMERARSKKETSNGEERDLDRGQLEDSAGDNSHTYTDIVPALKGVLPRRKHHRAWTLSEVLKLVEGVARFGAGRWSEIRRLAFASYSYRTSVDLKDKWRNLLRASLAQGSTQNVAKSSQKFSSMPIPKPILLRVRELAEMQSQPGIEFGPTTNSSAGRAGRIEQQEKGSGFL